MRSNSQTSVFSVAVAVLALSAVLLFRQTDRSESQTLRAEDGASRHVLPDEAARQEASSYVKKLYARDYVRAGSDASRLLLAKRLLRIADETKDDGDALCGLLLEAKRLAVDSGSVEVAFTALDKMQLQFRYDSSLDKAIVLEQLSGAGASITSIRSVSRLAVSALEQATAADQFEAAQKILSAGTTAARRIQNAALARQLADLEMPIEALKQQHAELQKALVTLEERPEDKEANLVVGRVLTLRNGDWIKAERHANLSADEELRKLLLSEIDKPATIQSRLSHADSWWAYALTLPDLEKQQAQLIATGHYLAILPELTGLTKNRIEKRSGSVQAIAMLRNPAAPQTVEIADVPAARPAAVRRIDLLADFDVSRDVDHGAVKKNGRVLEAEASSKGAQPGLLYVVVVG